MADDDRLRLLLLGALGAQRRHVLAALDGLTDAQLRTSALPSGWSPIGLVRHLTLGGERYWLHTVMAGEPLDYWPEDRPALDGARPADWRVEPAEPADAVLQQYRDAIARSDAILQRLQLDATPLRPEPDWPADRFPDLAAVLVHIILDAATHAGTSTRRASSSTADGTSCSERLSLPPRDSGTPSTPRDPVHRVLEGGRGPVRDWEPAWLR